jgi:hypothetical protein
MGPLLAAFVLLAAAFIGPSPALLAAEGPSTSLVGAWKLVKDDDTPDGPIPVETMSFWPNGKFSILAKRPYEGRYEVVGSDLRLLVKVRDRGITLSRRFQLAGDELKFKNDPVGWVYYQRVSQKPLGTEPAL